MYKSKRAEGGTISRMPPQKPSVRRVSRQREAGEATRRETRRRLLLAASEEFAQSGYRAATVSRIADRADVSVQTLYHSWGSKRDLLRGVLELAVTGHEEGSLDEGAVRRTLLATIDPEDAKIPSGCSRTSCTGSECSPSVRPASGAPTATRPPSTPTSHRTGAH